MSKRICEDCGRDMSHTVHSTCNGFAIEVDEDIPDVPHPHHNAKTVAVFKRTAMSTKEENKPLTLQECKDLDYFYEQVASKHGLGKSLVTGHKASYFKEAAELYASQFRSTTPEQWIPVSERLPEDDEQLVIFIEWHERWKRVIEQYVSKWINVKQHREFDLKKNYTHWMPLPPPPGHKIDDTTNEF